MRTIVSIIFIMVLSGCSQKGWFRDRSEDFTQAESCKTIKVPAELQPKPFNHEYDIP